MVVDSLRSRVPLLKSKAVLGVLGVFPVLPKLAKAPLPRPNAEEAPAPVVGEAREGAEPRALKGLLLLVALALPSRLADELSESRVSLRSFCLTFKLSLLLLMVVCAISD